ncbi:uncharacterized protein B0H18DRAFT_1218497 [Fomitopsis serialis]|uniref:uncharacterized protein n=1 Tax=Fomitopsis serialis TaxID=139415 RepID=UPI00200843B1|nr:uncharacterized protein B0H18DRAFT_1218497 [Neoantrodia serialis]KAH9911119.1 hypothetical protein B0H18DRAFT_1218497 [Neoantrodia serialis]
MFSRNRSVFARPTANFSVKRLSNEGKAVDHDAGRHHACHVFAMELIWKNANGVSAIFVFNRVITLGLVFAYAAQFQHYSYGSCKGASIVNVVFSLLSYMMWAVVSGLRVYALTKRSWALSVLTFVLGMAPWVPDVYIGATLSFDVISLPVGNRDLCQENTTLSQGFQRKALIICRVSSIISDLIVLFVTIYRISPRSFIYSRKMFTKRSFAQILLRDGCIYFVMLTTFNALEIILYLAAAKDYINTFIAPIAAVSVSRFILNLRTYAAAPSTSLDSQDDSEGTTTARESASQTLTFAFAAVTHLDTMVFVEDDATEHGTCVSYVGSSVYNPPAESIPYGSFTMALARARLSPAGFTVP